MSRILALLKTNTTTFPSDLLDAITSAGGSPVQIWSSDSGFYGVIAEGDASVQTAMSGHAAVACATSDSIPSPQSLDVDPGATELAGAWNTYLSSDYQTAVTGFYNSSMNIDAMLPPGGCNQNSGDDGDGGSGPLVASNGPTGATDGAVDTSADASADPAGGAASLGTPLRGGAAGLPTVTVVHKERRALVGTVGVAIGFVGGPTGSTAELTPDNNGTLSLAMIHAFNVYYDLAPAGAHLVFEVNVRRANLTLDPTTVPVPANAAAPAAADWEAAEAPWRDAALKAWGQAAGMAGVDAFISSASFSTTPDYAYAALLTNYPVAWESYTSGARKVVYQLTGVLNDWKLAGAHFVFAHETGHTSGAPDEYAASHCSLTDKSGFSNSANTNCENGNAASVDCLMRNNTKKLCPATPGHFGWNDSNGDGVLDPFDSTYST